MIVERKKWGCNEIRLDPPRERRASCAPGLRPGRVSPSVAGVGSASAPGVEEAAVAILFSDQIIRLCLDEKKSNGGCINIITVKITPPPPIRSMDVVWLSDCGPSCTCTLHAKSSTLSNAMFFLCVPKNEIFHLAGAFVLFSPLALSGVFLCTRTNDKLIAPRGSFPHPLSDTFGGKVCECK